MVNGAYDVLDFGTVFFEDGIEAFEVFMCDKLSFEAYKERDVGGVEAFETVCFFDVGIEGLGEVCERDTFLEME